LVKVVKGDVGLLFRNRDGVGNISRRRFGTTATEVPFFIFSQ
jgi:hypothetical protein